MEKPKINRTLIHIVSRFSNWQATDIESFFRENDIYANQNDWSKFIKTFLMSLGIAFLVSGVIFFFAYNWASLHKFAKLGLVQVLLIAMVGVAVFSKLNKNIKGIILMGAGMLVGAMFAVFGQIYQTGANAYDFFFGWTAFIALWVFVSNFGPMWLLFLALINISIWQYFEQVLGRVDEVIMLDLLFVINLLYLVLLKVLAHFEKIASVPRWLERIIVLVSIAYLTFNLCFQIMDFDIMSYLTVLLGLIALPLAIYYGSREKDTFFIATSGLSIILIFLSLLIKAVFEGGDGIGGFFIISIYVIGSISGLIFSIVNLNKEWHGDDK
ncbi:MAG: DUF2157 domain-containing protein [Saprospiraceae bacterium]